MRLISENRLPFFNKRPDLENKTRIISKNRNEIYLHATFLKGDEILSSCLLFDVVYCNSVIRIHYEGKTAA